MSTNPYSKPRGDAQSPPARKPLAAWLLQFALLPAAAMALLYAVLAPLHAMDAGDTQVALLAGVVSLALFAPCVATVIAIQRRKPEARWLASLVIVFFMLLSLWEMVPSSYHRETHGWGAGRLIGIALVLGLEAWWLHAAAWSAKARRYFGPQSR